MENSNHPYENNAIIEADSNDFAYNEPDTQEMGITEEDYADSYNFYPDAVF